MLLRYYCVCTMTSALHRSTPTRDNADAPAAPRLQHSRVGSKNRETRTEALRDHEQIAVERTLHIAHDRYGQRPVKRMRDRTRNAGERIAVAAERYRVAHGVFE